MTGGFELSKNEFIRRLFITDREVALSYVRNSRDALFIMVIVKQNFGIKRKNRFGGSGFG
jgi:hypothetical protein